MTSNNAAQALCAAEELTAQKRESLAALAHDELLETAVALAMRCRKLEVGRFDRPYIYTLPDELLSRVLVALPVLSRFRLCAVSRRFKRLLFTPALREELRAAVDPIHVLLSGHTLDAGRYLLSPAALVYRGPTRR